MKSKILLALIILPMFVLSVESQDSTLLSVGYGRFSPADPRYEQVYTSGREVYSLEITRPVLRSGRHRLALSGGLRRFVKKGRSTLTLDPAKLTLHPLSLGVRYILDLDLVRPWTELGLDRVGYKEDSSLQTSSGSAFGYHVQAGVSIHPPGLDFLGLEVHVRHSRARAEENGVSANLGGFEYGIGLTIAFELF